MDSPVLAAVSGGADSLALAAALAFERPGSGALVVDHGLQAGSAVVAARAAEQCRSLGLSAQVLSTPPVPADHGLARTDHGEGAAWLSVADTAQLHDRRETGGPEARARELRYGLLEQAAAACDAPGGQAVVLLGHTREDQAESVLLGLVRGSGARALAGMAPVRGRYRRPFLDLPRGTVRQACAEAGLAPYEDPHNQDPAYRRVVVRRLLGELDITDGLARTAALLREDDEALEELAVPTDDVGELAAMLPALRARALKRWAEQQCGRAVTRAHVAALRELVEDWHGQGPVALPGGGRVTRRGGRLAFTG
ncbi:MAG TPA: tRNA lysidine(34) synthetase [Mycobacteriales bacterium]|nr:tRNA lysidine(34) synthetase [Mycobacteriales bacterium]